MIKRKSKECSSVIPNKLKVLKPEATRTIYNNGNNIYNTVKNFSHTNMSDMTKAVHKEVLPPLLRLRILHVAISEGKTVIVVLKIKKYSNRMK